MSRHSIRPRGFTLIELLVAMAIMVTLAAIALVVVPGALDQDRTVDATSTVQQALRLARAKALRDQESRGIRFIVEPGKPGIATSMQQIGSMPMMVPRKGSPNATLWPRVDLVTSGGSLKVYLRNMVPEEAAILLADIANSALPRLHLPDLTGPSGDKTFFRVTAMMPAGTDYELALDPMPRMGAGTEKRIFHFAFLLEPKPMMGEPLIPLPKDTCVDLNASRPSSTVDAEIVFDRNGNVVYEGTEIVYLWVRDYTKTPQALIQLSPGVYDPAPFQSGGQQRVISLTRPGATSAYPPLFPRADGTYAAGQTPWTK